MKKYRFLGLMAVVLILLGMGACTAEPKEPAVPDNGAGPSAPASGEQGAADVTKAPVTEALTPEPTSTPTPEPAPAGYRYEGTETKAPYTVYNKDGTVAGGPFDSMFLAIHYAGENALSSNPMYVNDANGLMIFKRQGLSSCWVYDGTNYVGTMPQQEAVAWAAEHARSYVVNGRGTGYVYLGSNDYTERHPDNVYELTSGAYSYLYSAQGTLEANQWVENGYAYASGYVRLSEATYYDSPDSQWNAYIFFNIRGNETCDLGIGCYAGGGGQWKIGHNCSDESHKNGTDPYPSFYVWHDQVVTTMTRDPETGIYSGADDLFIEAIAGEDAWTLRVTNLRTNEVFGYTHPHEGMNEGADGYYRVVVAASLCPVIGTVWDTRAGGYLKNVIWEDVRVARYKADGVYTEADKEVMYPGLDTVQYAYTQAADCAHLVIGTHETDGTYKSGAAYQAGGTYLSFSSYYDGTHVEE